MINLLGQFSPSTMAGRKYVTQYPNLLTAVVNSSSFEAGHSDTIQLSSKLYLQVGELQLAASPNKRFYPGMLLTLSGLYNATKGYAVVVRYSSLSGALTISIQGFSGAVIHGPFLYITVSVNGATKKKTGPLGFTENGTGYKTPDEVFLSLEFDSPKEYAAEVIDDFIGKIDEEFPSPYKVVSKVGTARFYSYPEVGQLSSFNPEGRAGFLALKVSATSDIVSLQRGSAYRNLLTGTSDLKATSHTFYFYIPALSTSGERYRFKIGLSANGGTEVGTFGGITLSYADNENSGAFAINYGFGGSVTTVSGDAVVAGWHSLALTASEASVDVYVDGVLKSTILSAGIYGTTDNNVFSPCFSLEKLTGSSQRLIILDSYSSLQKVVR